MKIELHEGKYTYIFEAGNQKALRYGEPWRDLTGDNLILAMAQRIESLETELVSYSDKEEMISIAESLATKEEGKFSGLNYSEEGDGGVRVIVYKDNWDYTAGTNDYFYTWEELRSELELEK